MHKVGNNIEGENILTEGNGKCQMYDYDDLDNDVNHNNNYFYLTNSIVNSMLYFILLTTCI